jgi:hypothetical protein
MFHRLVACIIVLGAAALVYGQEEPWGLASTTINGEKVVIEYGRPNLRGRALADLMKHLPPDRIWRAGAGAITLLSTKTDLLIGGKKIPAGDYGLYVYCPASGDYALVINSELDEPPGTVLPEVSWNRDNRPFPNFMSYSLEIADKEVARIPMKQISSPRTEVLIFSFEPAGKGALLKIWWGEKAWTVEFQPAD